MLNASELTAKDYKYSKRDILDWGIVPQWHRKNNTEIYITKVLLINTKPAVGCKQQ